MTSHSTIMTRDVLNNIFGKYQLLNAHSEPPVKHMRCCWLAQTKLRQISHIILKYEFPGGDNFLNTFISDDT